MRNVNVRRLWDVEPLTIQLPVGRYTNSVADIHMGSGSPDMVLVDGTEGDMYGSLPTRYVRSVDQSIMMARRSMNSVTEVRMKSRSLIKCGSSRWYNGEMSCLLVS